MTSGAAIWVPVTVVICVVAVAFVLVCIAHNPDDDHNTYSLVKHKPRSKSRPGAGIVRHGLMETYTYHVVEGPGQEQDRLPTRPEAAHLVGALRGGMVRRGGGGGEPEDRRGQNNLDPNMLERQPDYR